jgi:hypothetical protein
VKPFKLLCVWRLCAETNVLSNWKVNTADTGSVCFDLKRVIQPNNEIDCLLSLESFQVVSVFEMVLLPAGLPVRDSRASRFAAAAHRL